MQEYTSKRGGGCWPKALDKALKNIDIAFYLIHSLSQDKDFENLEIKSAQNFVKSAEKNNVKKPAVASFIWNLEIGK